MESETSEGQQEHEGVPASMVSDLADIVGRAHVLTDEPDLFAYNGDCSPRGIMLTRGRRVERHRPLAVVQPAGDGEIRELVEWAGRTSTPLIPFGDGSGVCRGAVADGPAVIVDVKRLDELVDVDRKNLSARIQPGMNGYLLERELNRRGLTAGHYPSSLYCSSVGGWVAARGAGQYSSYYGKIEDIVSSVRLVTGGGDTIRTAAAPAGARAEAVGPGGPNLTQLAVGSEGTLGVISEVTLNLDTAPDHREYRGFQFSELSNALSAVREIMQSGSRPAVLRLYDPLDTLVKSTGSGDSSGILSGIRRTFERVVPEALRSQIERGVDQARETVFTRLLGRAAMVNPLIDSLASKCLLVIGYEGTDPVIEEEAEWAFRVLNRHGVDLGVEPGEEWRRNRFSVSYKQSPLFDTGAFVDTMEVSTTWDNVERLYRRVRRALRPHVTVLAHFSHVYSEGSSIYFTFAGWAPDTESSLELYRTVWETGLDAVAAAGGSITHHHGVGDQKSKWTGDDHVGGPSGFEALKAVFDPEGIMNPGKVYE